MRGEQKRSFETWAYQALIDWDCKTSEMMRRETCGKCGGSGDARCAAEDQKARTLQELHGEGGSVGAGRCELCCLFDFRRRTVRHGSNVARAEVPTCRMCVLRSASRADGIGLAWHDLCRQTLQATFSSWSVHWYKSLSSVCMGAASYST